ncbi:acetyl-CoA C-acyltransferase, partial [Lactobacillus delbrueckii subsp. bulgaricus]|nr:acetyl-CoA C-acyltransferase [Lactobacillus delbrueckii subsp. bulgaricus]
ALGHPLGASGTRLLATAARQLQRGGQRAIASLCIGGGLAIAFEIEKA